MSRYAIVMAAGKGSRMKSLDENHSKVSYPILNKPIIRYVIDAIKPLGFNKIVTVVGFGGEVSKKLAEVDTEVVWQKEQKGTGHAVMMATSELENLEGSTLVVCGDTPLITTETIQKLFDKHERNHFDMTILTSLLDNPTGYGRIVREEKTNNILAIREDKDCSDLEKYIKEINTGIYIFDNKKLFYYLKHLKTNNAQHEYYLTDVVSMFVNDKLKVGGYVLEDPEEAFGINDRFQLSYAQKVIRKRVNKALMLSGVSIEDPNSTYISIDVKIGQDTIIHPNTTIYGNKTIGTGNEIGPNSYLDNVEVGNNNKIISSHLVDTQIGDNNEIGPFTRTRGGTIIENNTRVGNFVEFKNVHIHNGVKSAHLTYLGDTEVGEKTNIGCMTVTANYDGYNKSHTQIGKNTFIGSGSILVAPIEIKDNSFVAAGSTITKPVDEDDLAIARSRQVNLKNGAIKVKEKARIKKETNSVKKD
ncbi:MAG: bifunctional UDP-N-acetylglucosamine diphosphorylase/glucosamine-1-phosphate N-acetyltransferase GlmU [Bacilli bacterium]